MGFSIKFRRGIWFAVLLLLLASPLSAQIEDHLTAYTGANATGYLNPLVSAVGTSLNGGLWRSAYIPKSGLNIALEFPFVGLYFKDEDKHFMGTTESGFSPETTASVPTVIGPTKAVIVEGDGGTLSHSGTTYRFRSVWSAKEMAYELTPFVREGNRETPAGITLYLRRLPGERLWLGAPPVVFHREKAAKQPGFWDWLFGRKG